MITLKTWEEVEYYNLIAILPTVEWDKGKFYVGKDKSGRWYLYDDKPVKRDEFWWSKGYERLGSTKSLDTFPNEFWDIYLFEVDLREEKARFPKGIYTGLLLTYERDVVDKMFNFQGEERDIEHIKAGLFSEIGELLSALKKKIGYDKDLDKINILEECGDIFFFLIALKLVKGEDYDEDAYGMWEVENIGNTCLIDSPQIFNLYQAQNFIMRFLINNVVEYIQEKSSFSELMRIFGQMVFACFGFSVEEIITSNTRKLQSRHKGTTYNSKEVLNRDFEKEREELCGR